MDDQEAQLRLLEITQAHMTKKLGRGACPLCHQDEWMFLGTSMTDGVVSGLMRGFFFAPTMAKHLEVKLACQNCGNIVTFLASKIDGFYDVVDDIQGEGESQ